MTMASLPSHADAVLDAAHLAPARTVLRPGILPPTGPQEWTTACSADMLVPGRGVAVLLPGDAQAALFLQPNGMLYAIDNLDPFAGATVLSRGLTGDHDGEPMVASPLLKQRFSLRTGQCLDAPEVSVRTYSVRVAGGLVRIGSAVPNASTTPSALSSSLSGSLSSDPASSADPAQAA